MNGATKTSDDYRACVCVYPDGTIRRANVQYIRLMSVDKAREKLAAGQAAYLSPDVYAAEFQQAAI